MNQNDYWAGSPTSEIAQHLKTKIDDYYKFLENSSILGELRKSYVLFYGNSAIQEFENGQTTMQVNHYRSLISSIHTMVTQNRPAFEARAINSDHESQAVTQLANGLCDYYLREKNLEEHLKKATELALYLREGYVIAEWSPDSGEMYAIDPESNQPTFEGDVEYNVAGMLEVVRDFKNKSNNHSWYIVKKQKNKWDLAANYPELKDEILSAKTSVLDESRYNLAYTDTLQGDSDQIDYWTFFHAKTPALPNGRLVTMVGNTVLFDGPLPYKKPYVFCIKANDAYQTAFGHSPAMDCIPLQDALDSCFSVALSNINNFGMGAIISEKGETGFKRGSSGMLEIQINKGATPPQMLNMLQIPAEIFNFANMLIQNQETISGVNAVARGNVPHQMSGTAMALVAQQALTFSSGLQQSYNQLLEHVGSALIELLQTYAMAPRIAHIAGKTKKSFLQEFKGSDLGGISRIVVESSNALTKTTAGKVEIANNLLQSGLITTPEQYLQVVLTGNLEPLTEHDSTQLLLIRKENEMLSKGQVPRALIIDNHGLHVMEHSTVLSDPEVRNNPTLYEAALEHLQEHIELAKTADPILMQMLKQQPLPPPPPKAPQGNPNLPMPEPQTMQEANTPPLPIVAGTNQRFNPQG